MLTSMQLVSCPETLSGTGPAPVWGLIPIRANGATVCELAAGSPGEFAALRWWLAVARSGRRGPESAIRYFP
jgi:hypothetical protein